MAARKNGTTTTSETKTTRKRRDLAERLKSFDVDKIMRLKAEAERTIRLIASEGLRRQGVFTQMQDLSILTEVNETGTTAVTGTVTGRTPSNEPNISNRSSTGTPTLPENGRTQTTSP